MDDVKRKIFAGMGKVREAQEQGKATEQPQMATAMAMMKQRAMAKHLCSCSGSNGANGIGPAKLAHHICAVMELVCKGAVSRNT